MSQLVITHSERVRLVQILPNPFQPRLVFEDIESLASTISEDGLLHKIVARRHPNEVGVYQIVDGERRLRAIQALQWEFLEIEVGDYTDLQMATLALKSDTEHKSFSVIEVATGYRNLIDHFGKTNADIAAEYSVSAPVVSNRLRLLALPAPTLELMKVGKLLETHGKTLCSIIDDTTAVELLAQQCTDEQWSSRRLEAEVAAVKERIEAAQSAKANGEQPRLLDEPDGGVQLKGEPLVGAASIFATGNRIEWKSKMAPDARIFGTVQEVTPKYLVVLPDGMSETVHLDFNVKKLPPLPKAEPESAVEATQVEAASQSSTELSKEQKSVLGAIAADQDAATHDIAEEIGLSLSDVEDAITFLISRELIIQNDIAFSLTATGEMEWEAAQPIERGADAANETPEKSDNDKQLESRAHETPAQNAGTGGVGTSAPASEGVGFATSSGEDENLKPAPKAVPTPAPALESDNPSMTATIPGAEADWLDAHELNVATVCALYRRFHQACEGAQTDPETMIATLEARAESLQSPDTSEEEAQ